MKQTKLLKIIVLTTSSMIPPFCLKAEIKMKNFQELTSGVKEAGDTVQELALYLSGIGIAIAIVWVVYVLATNNPKAREHIVGVVSALVFYLLAVNVIF